jgi:hypothetical protein
MSRTDIVSRLRGRHTVTYDDSAAPAGPPTRPYVVRYRDGSVRVKRLTPDGAAHLHERGVDLKVLEPGDPRPDIVDAPSRPTPRPARQPRSTTAVRLSLSDGLLRDADGNPLRTADRELGIISWGRWGR